MRFSYIAIIILTALFAVLATPQAKAQTSRLYMAGYLGVNLYDDLDVADNAGGGAGNGNITLNNTPSFAGAMGLRLSRNLRVEAELSYRAADTDRFNLDTGGSLESNGEVKQYLGLMNLYYDFDVPWNVKPFVNAGAGFGWYDVSMQGQGFTYEDKTTAFTWTAGAGLKYRPRRDLAFTAGYRFLDSADLNFEDFDLDYSSHEIRIGIEYDLH